jgi:hypothetical protein
MSTKTYRRSGPTKVHDEAGNSQAQHALNQARDPQVEQAADQAQDSQVDHSKQEVIDHINKGPPLQINDAIISAIELGTRRLQELRDSTAEPYTDEPDSNREDLIRNPPDVSSLRDPSVNSISLLVDRLQRINLAILRNTEPPAPSEKPTVFYRVTTLKSHTSYDYRLGFWSARGLPDHDFEEPPTKDEFCEHVKDINFKSPYISMTSSPGRACQYGNAEGRLVYEIDGAKLLRMGVDIEPTTDIAERHGIKTTEPDRLEYVTPTYWLARFWIPAECIVRRVHSLHEFREKCIEAGLVYSMFCNSSCLAKGER